VKFLLNDLKERKDQILEVRNLSLHNGCGLGDAGIHSGNGCSGSIFDFNENCTGEIQDVHINILIVILSDYFLPDK